MPVPSQRWLTRCSVVNGQCVTPGSRPSTRSVLPIFYFLALGLTHGPKFTKIRDDLLLPTRSAILPNFITLRLPTPEISVTKNCGQRNKETANDISLSAHGDNKKLKNAHHLFCGRAAVEFLLLQRENILTLSQ